MEWIWIIPGIILIIGGIAGSILPLLPGPPVAYAGLLIQQLRTDKPFTTNFLLIWAGIVVIILVLDYLVPIWGTRRFGGTKYGVWGCTLGFILAFWMGPWGVVLGPFIGAFIGELIANQDSRQAFKAATGSFIGFLFGSLIKIIACFMMLYYVIRSIWFWMRIPVPISSLIISCFVVYRLHYYNSLTDIAGTGFDFTLQCWIWICEI